MQMSDRQAIIVRAMNTASARMWKLIGKAGGTQPELWKLKRAATWSITLVTTTVGTNGCLTTAFAVRHGTIDNGNASRLKPVLEYQLQLGLFIRQRPTEVGTLTPVI